MRDVRRGATRARRTGAMRSAGAHFGRPRPLGQARLMSSSPVGQLLNQHGMRLCINRKPSLSSSAAHPPTWCTLAQPHCGRGTEAGWSGRECASM